MGEKKTRFAHEMQAEEVIVVGGKGRNEGKMGLRRGKCVEGRGKKG